MAKVLTSFSGRFGDILWSLPTVRAVSQVVGGERVDFGIMPAYRSLLPLLNDQPYINKAFVIENWVCEGSPYGDQPWKPPTDAEANYERCFHLTYKLHPGIHRSPIALIDFVAEQQGLKLVNPIPFITAEKHWWYMCDPEVFMGYERNAHIAYAFNPGAAEMKALFLDVLRQQFGDRYAWVDVSKMDWQRAAALTKSAVCFVGCRSAMNVIAHGVGQKNIFIYEPDMSRHANGQFGRVFGCPYSEERTHDPSMTPEDAAVSAAEVIRNWQEQYQLQEAT